MIRLGDDAVMSRCFARADVEALVALGGAGGATVPDALIGAMFSALLGTRLPGPGTNYLKQTLQFHAPAPFDVPLLARVAVTRLRADRHLVDLATTCWLPDGTLVCDGRALVLARDVAGAWG